MDTEQITDPDSFPSVARVLLDTRLPQLSHLFDYRVPASLVQEIKVGHRVKVPLRGRARQNFGWVIELSNESEFQGELAPLESIVGKVPLLTPAIYNLAAACADRAAGNTSDILRIAIPGRHARAEANYLAEINETPAQNNDAVEQQQHSNQLLLENLSADSKQIAAALQDGRRLAHLANHGVTRLQTGEWIGNWAKQLSEIAAALLAAERSTIICVPDWRDLEQLQHSLESNPLTAQALVRLDTKQSPEKRFAQYLQTLGVKAKIIIGNRAAVYAPTNNLGAVIIWDEGDPLLNEPLAPYVHPRDAALIRGSQTGCGLLFASHSNSAEIERLKITGYLESQSNPPKRTKMRHADMSATPDQYAGRIPAAALRLIREGLTAGPVLVQVAKPGYAGLIVCASCEMSASCSRCKGPLGQPTVQRNLQCLWCRHTEIRWRCSNCAGTKTQAVLAGSQLTVERLQQQIPGYRVILADGENLVERVDSRPAIVVATVGAEPLAAGGYSAVVLLDAPRLLRIPTLRAGEDCLRWWSNAAAKAGPLAICMLASGAGPVVNAFLKDAAAGWLQQELIERKELLYPPAIRVATLQGELEVVQQASTAAQTVPETNVLPPTKITEGKWQVIVRSSYRAAPQLANVLRAQVVSAAAGRWAPTRARPKHKAQTGLRVKFDDRTVFDEPPITNQTNHKEAES